jgi:hypothetical protein
VRSISHWRCVTRATTEPVGRINATLLILVALALPAAALAVTPKSGVYSNKDQTKGLWMETKGHTIRTLWLFCRNHAYDGNTTRPELRKARYETRHPIHVRDNGSFSYSGTGTRYGTEGQPLGHWRMSLTGRFTSRTHVKIRRTLKGCGPTYTATAHRTGS